MLCLSVAFLSLCGLVFSQWDNLRVVTVNMWRLVSKRKKGEDAEPVKNVLRTGTVHLPYSIKGLLIFKGVRTETALLARGDFIVEKHVGGKIVLWPYLENIIYNINYFELLRKVCNSGKPR